MNDKYPRVMHYGVSRGPIDYYRAVDFEAPEIVVPADAIVIERSELPEVTVVHGELVSGELICAPESVEYARRAAIEWLSVSEHLSVHTPVQPPVDPKVRADLADALVRAGVGTSWSDCARIAEDLISNSPRLPEDGAR